ncbi:hypothetical protein JD844_020391 [Phrynosoma platyrhinos]|uniref:AP-5 complex subunit mu-1 n=1 Tax=Phrynosoma platyrhinos TaxID=52577 RepID=A0ABQ7SSK8_PHRPL|nr:hypothetical protein JD844_020391 [Phrynosoma platyrhinos]
MPWKHYPTVEKRAKFFNGPSYVPIPEDGPFLKALLFELRLTDGDQHFVERRDGCSQINKTSVYALQAEEGDLWPVVAFQKSGLIYVALPLVEQSISPHPPLFNINGISQAFDLLSGLLAFMSSGQKSEAERSIKISQLPGLLMQACPLGTPLDTNLNSSLLETINAAPSSHPQKPPAWRTSTYKGKPHVNVCITEKVKSVQYDKRDVADMWQVYGTVTCKCDIEGTAPNVTVSLNLPANGSPLQDILVHPCVTSLDSAVLTSSSVDIIDDSAFSGPYKFPLIPPPDLWGFHVPVPPILGFYQLKEEESQWRFTIHLKLHESVKNAFEYCEARVPFFNRGPITHLEYKVSYGQLEVSKEKSLLVWIIAKNYSLYFRILDFTLTGCYTDQHSIQVFSSGKPKISTAREVLASDYYIWNSKAPAPVVYRTLLF